jgi:hypothetical protein
MYAAWTGLGFYRGVNHYRYTNNRYDSKKPILYTNVFLYGALGFVFYCIPITLPVTIYKEVYRLEVNLRGWQEEKKSSHYNDLF